MTAGKSSRSAVIVGGGIGGLSAALALAKRGCRVTVIEQADKFGEIGAGIQIGPNGFHAMDYLGHRRKGPGEGGIHRSHHHDGRHERRTDLSLAAR